MHVVSCVCSGAIGSENMHNIDNMDEDFHPLTLKRSIIPRHTPTARWDNIITHTHTHTHTYTFSLQCSVGMKFILHLKYSITLWRTKQLLLKKKKKILSHRDIQPPATDYYKQCVNLWFVPAEPPSLDIQARLAMLILLLQLSAALHTPRGESSQSPYEVNISNVCFQSLKTGSWQLFHTSVFFFFSVLFIFCCNSWNIFFHSICTHIIIHIILKWV